jgi:DNA-binding MarR family transcriptional regulator
LVVVAAAAGSVHLGGNRFSTVLKRGGAAGLVHRAVARAAPRAARLTLTDAARERLARWRSARGVLVADALERLPTSDVAALEAALPALKNLVRELA